MYCKNCGAPLNDGAKFCETVFIKEQWYNAVVSALNAGISPNWKVTDAKFVAYSMGLEMPYGEQIEVPFLPEDFEFFPSLEVDIMDDVAYNTVDGNVQFGRRAVKQNLFDGQLIMHVSDKMREKLVQRMVAQGTDEWDARRIVKRFVKTLSAT